MPSRHCRTWRVSGARRMAHGASGRVRGMVLPVLLAVVMAVVVVLAAGWQAAAAERATAQADLRRQRAVQAAARALHDWYGEHLAELDSPGSRPPDPASVLAGLAAASGVQVALGDLQTEGEVPGRRLRAWTGQGGARTDAGTLVDGHELEREALRRARRQLQGLTARFETWYRARLLSDPLHLVDRNWWRPADPACLAERDELPCLPDWTDLRHAPGVAQALGLPEEAWRTPWGDCCPVEASNGSEDAGATPPFTLALRIRTPWNSVLQSRAVQAGGQP